MLWLGKALNPPRTEFHGENLNGRSRVGFQYSSIGFITQESSTEWGLKPKISVFCEFLTIFCKTLHMTPLLPRKCCYFCGCTNQFFSACLNIVAITEQNIYKTGKKTNLWKPFFIPKITVIMLKIHLQHAKIMLIHIFSWNKTSSYARC